MKNILQEYPPERSLADRIDSYWFSRNHTGKTIDFPVVPDGCSDIIFYLNNSVHLPQRNDTFISGAMEYAEIVQSEPGTELFGIRFRPGQLSYFLDLDMSSLTNRMETLASLHDERYRDLTIDRFGDNETIISGMNQLLSTLYRDVEIEKLFIDIVEEICRNPDLEISRLAESSSFSVKSLERYFKKRVGYTPKKFARIMRFQKAHKSIQKESMVNLITVAHQSGYFDQAHFNREYRKFVGCAPTSETLSILYNTSR